MWQIHVCLQIVEACSCEVEYYHWKWLLQRSTWPCYIDPRDRVTEIHVTVLQRSTWPCYRDPCDRVTEIHMTVLQRSMWPCYRDPRDRVTESHVTVLQRATWPCYREPPISVMYNTDNSAVNYRVNTLEMFIYSNVYAAFNT